MIYEALPSDCDGSGYQLPDGSPARKGSPCLRKFFLQLAVNQGTIHQPCKIVKFGENSNCDGPKGAFGFSGHSGYIC